MNRRDALARVSLLFGGALIGGDVFLSGCSTKKEKALDGMAFDDEQISFLNEIAETILPTTSKSPGAKDAKVGEFMNVIVTECYTAEEQSIFTKGISTIDDRAKSSSSKAFAELAPEDKLTLLNEIDAEAKGSPDQSKNYFVMMKQLTLWGYFTSEVGSTKALRYVPVPGKYEGCIPYTKGEGAWAAI